MHHFDAKAGAAPFRKIKQPHGHGTILCIRIPRNFTAHALVHYFSLLVPILDFVVFVYTQLLKSAWVLVVMLQHSVSGRRIER
jgi:hypothetical protein